MARADTINAPRGGKRIAARARAAVGYVRRSTDRQEQSIPDQKRAIEEYLDDHDLRLLRFYVDDAISGTSTIGRRAFLDMIADAKRRSCDFRFVVVYDVKRFGRVDNDEAGYYRHILRTEGVEIIYVSENFTGDGTDDLLRPVKQWQAREESKDLAKVVIRGQLSKTESGGGGWWMGGAPPYGYDLAYESQTGQCLFYLRYMQDGSKQMFNDEWKLIRTLQRGESVAVSRRDRCKLVPSEPSRVETIKRIFAMYVQERRGFKAIADRLTKDGIPTSRGPQWSAQYSGFWSLTSVRGILANQTYCGDIVWNKRTDARFYRIVDGRAVERKGVIGRRLELNDESDWIIIPGAHTPLVSRCTFDTVRQRLDAKPSSKLQRGINPRTGAATGERTQPGELGGPRAKFLLSRLCTCSRCGSRYEGYTRYPCRTNSLHEKTLHYACGGYIRHGRSVCTVGAVHKEQLEEAVIEGAIEFYKRYTAEGKGEALIKKAIQQQLGTQQGQAAEQRLQCETEIERIDGLVRNLLDHIKVSNRDMVNQRLDELSRERDSLESQLASLNQTVLEEDEIQELVQETIIFASSLDSTLHHGSLDQRRTALRRCVDTIVVDHQSKRAEIKLRVLPMGLDSQAAASTKTVIVKLTKKSAPKALQDEPTE